MAKLLYNEPYLTRPMRHEVETARTRGTTGGTADAGNRCPWRARQATGRTIAAGSEEEFITEHYWGYNRQRDGRTLEYQVEHPRWRVRRARDHRFDCDVENLYGAEFVPFLTGKASSAFLVEGSAVNVRKGRAVAAG